MSSQVDAAAKDRAQTVRELHPIFSLDVSTELLQIRISVCRCLVQPHGTKRGHAETRPLKSQSRIHEFIHVIYLHVKY